MKTTDTITDFNYKVEVIKMNGQDTRVRHFPTYEKALQYYAAKSDELNIEDGHRDWPAVENGKTTEVDLNAGGRGYDYRVSLVVEEDI